MRGYEDSYPLRLVLTVTCLLPLGAFPWAVLHRILSCRTYRPCFPLRSCSNSHASRREYEQIARNAMARAAAGRQLRPGDEDQPGMDPLPSPQPSPAPDADLNADALFAPAPPGGADSGGRGASVARAIERIE